MDLASSVLLGAVQLVSVVVDLVAIVVAVARWSRHPTVSMLVVVSMGIALIVRGAWVVLPRLVSMGDERGLFTLTSAGLSLVSIVAFALLVVAVFIGRSTGTEPPAPRW